MRVTDYALACSISITIENIVRSLSRSSNMTLHKYFWWVSILKMIVHMSQQLHSTAAYRQRRVADTTEYRRRLSVFAVRCSWLVVLPLGVFNCFHYILNILKVKNRSRCQRPWSDRRWGSPLCIAQPIATPPEHGRNLMWSGKHSSRKCRENSREFWLASSVGLDNRGSVRPGHLSPVTLCHAI